MSVYVSLACREYVEGRICLTSDRLSGFITNHGFCSRKLWRNVFEWTGKKYPNEIINVGVIASILIPTIDYLDAFGQISYKVITTDDLSGDLSDIDVLYFIGLPLSVPSDVIEEYVRTGGGVIIECPNRMGEINVLSDIESINIKSIERPSYEISYWTEDGVDHSIYSNDAIVYFYSTLELNDLSSWTILMSSVKNESLTADGVSNTFIPTTASAISEFGCSYENYYKNGIVYLDEIIVNNKAVISSNTYHSFGEKVYSAKTIDRMYGVFTSNVIIASEEFLNWHNLTWKGQNGINTRVFLFAKSSDTQDGLNTSSWYGPYKNLSNDISILNGKYLQFMAILKNDGDNPETIVADSIGDVISGSVAQTNVSGGWYPAVGETFVFQVYAYKTVDGIRYYSKNPYVINFTDDGSYADYDISLNWGAVTGAEGYRLINSYWDYGPLYSYMERPPSYVDVNGSSVVYIYDYVTCGAETIYVTFYTVFPNIYPNNLPDIHTFTYDQFIENINVSFFSAQQSTKFFTKAFDVNFVPKHVLLTYNASNVDDNTIIQFAISGEDTADVTRYQYINPNKIEALNTISYSSSKVKVMLEFVGNSSIPVTINEFALMIGGDTVESMNVVANVAPVVIEYLLTEDAEDYLITEDAEDYLIIE